MYCSSISLTRPFVNRSISLIFAFSYLISFSLRESSSVDFSLNIFNYSFCTVISCNFSLILSASALIFFRSESSRKFSLSNNFTLLSFSFSSHSYRSFHRVDSLCTFSYYSWLNLSRIRFYYNYDCF
jgi:hypothetical protein